MASNRSHSPAVDPQSMCYNTDMPPPTKTLQLVTLDPAIDEALTSNPAYFEAMGAEDWGRVAEMVHAVVGRTLSVEPVSVDVLSWDGYCVVLADTREVIGSCAFKGPPAKDASVEIAYFTYPGFEGRGHATTMARKLIELAAGSPAVRQVIAHTLPETNASTRVLEKAGMTFAGEVVDPEDGRVWRWEVDVR